MIANFTFAGKWQPGIAPVAVVMISLNEGHNMEALLQNLSGWAQEVFLVDSHSADETVEVALRYGVSVVQRPFHGFGDQWNFALQELPINAPWTMKLDPDERLTSELKQTIFDCVSRKLCTGITFSRRLWFMGNPLPIKQDILRVWKTGKCKFSDVLVNEHPLVDGNIVHVDGELEHHDSPCLHHWYDKQNKYSTLEALSVFRKSKFSDSPVFWGSALQRRMWIKKYFNKIPFRFYLVFIYYFIFLSLWKNGKVGYIWSRLRADVYRMREYKLYEMLVTGKELPMLASGIGNPDLRVKQYY
ncbi:MAG: glycosyltransferase family 2 protein [Bacteroidia bacterium]|nr:glycosyltransferase family 2 protein [Bacteroidia bacterium]